MVAVGSLLVAPGFVLAQAPRYDLRQVIGAAFMEEVHSEVTTQSGSAERHRTIARSAKYSTALRADTVIVTADSLRLDETADGVHHEIDVDAVIGGRWRLGLDSRGVARVDDVPFVPGAVTDVSDLASAMDDFFPKAPPALAPGSQATDSTLRNWRRLSDSAGLQRYRWTARRNSDSTAVGPDSVQVHTVAESQEDGNVAWSVVRGPVRWLRQIHTVVTSRFAGTTVRAKVDQRVMVARAQ